MAEFHKTLARLMGPEEEKLAESHPSGAPGHDDSGRSRAETLAAVLDRLRRQAAAMEARARRGGQPAAEEESSQSPGLEPAPQTPSDDADTALDFPVADAWEAGVLRGLQVRHPAPEAARLARVYGSRLPEAYRRRTDPEDAVQDIDHLALVDQTRQSQAELLRVSRPDETFAALRLYVCDPSLVLSDFLRTLSNFGLRVLEHEALELELPAAGRVWMHTFRVQDTAAPEADVVAAGSRLLPALQAVYERRAADDALNALVHRAGLGWRAVDLMRSLAWYVAVAERRWTYETLAGALLAYPHVAVRLHDLIVAKFDPSAAAMPARERLEGPVRDAEEALEGAIDRVPDEAARARLGRLAAVVRAMTRTNFFCGSRGGDLPPLAFHARRSDGATDLFVWSDEVVGLCRRTGAISRGPLLLVGGPDDLEPTVDAGLRQIRERCVLSVAGAATAAVSLRQDLSRNGRRRAARQFAAAQLSLSDTVDRGRVMPPPGVVSYDDPNPHFGYTVEGSDPELLESFRACAAEQGNGLAAAYCDAPEGGARTISDVQGRSAWDAAVEALRDRGIDPDQTSLRVVCVGRVRGRAFAQGALQRRSLRLIAAFDDRHILVDPTPVPETAYWERQRLSRLPDSGWGDFNPSALGPGGGVFRRDARAIRLSSQLRTLLRIGKETVSGEELLQAVVLLPHHLLWVAGPGVEIGSAGEHQRRAGLAPVAAERIRARVVVEVEPGLTHRARVALASAGVALVEPGVATAAGSLYSDLDSLVRVAAFLRAEAEDGRLTIDPRVRSRAEDALREEALRGAARLRTALRAERERVRTDLGSFADTLGRLDALGIIDRSADAFPDGEELWRRLGSEPGLVDPELVRLHARVRRHLRALAREVMAEDESDLVRRFRDGRFPADLPEEFRQAVARHPLGAEVAATEVADQVATLMGVTFVHRVADELGADPRVVLRAWMTAVAFTEADEALREIEATRQSLSGEAVGEVLALLETSLQRCVRWLLELRTARRPGGTAPAGIVEAAQELLGGWTDILPEEARAAQEQQVRNLVEAGLAEPLAAWLMRIGDAADALEIAQLSAEMKLPPASVAEAYFGAGRLLGFDWLSTRLASADGADPWTRRARERLLRHLGLAHRELTRRILQIDPSSRSIADSISLFQAMHRSRLDSVLYLERAARNTPDADLAPLTVLVLEILSLVSEANA